MKERAEGGEKDGGGNEERGGRRKGRDGRRGGTSHSASSAARGHPPGRSRRPKGNEMVGIRRRKGN